MLKSVNMKHLWSPWRMTYITGEKQVDGCVFCHAQTLENGPESLIVHREARAYVILNRFPYTSGHLMVLPFTHVSTLAELDPATRAQMMELTTRVTGILDQVYHPQGFNIGINQGAAAGAGIAAHLHIHIVPRWNGDTNFMTAVGETRVLPESLAETWQRVRAAWV